MSEPTPGHWTAIEAKNAAVYMGETVIIDAAGQWVAVTHIEGQAAHANANAHLIAAAPDMKAACEAAEQCMADFIDVYKRNCSMQTFDIFDIAVKSMRDDGLKQVRAALEKAAQRTESEADNAL